MSTAKELRQYCEQLRKERCEELKSVLSDFFESTFIAGHKPFRAVIGNKKCKSIPIYRCFLAVSEGKVLNYQIQWPNFSEDLLRKELENLGFVITANNLCISVPPYEKGAKLSFAQEWVRKINTSYSDYCAKEKKFAKMIYSEIISALCSTPTDCIITCDGYTIFKIPKFDYEISLKRSTFIRSLMRRDGIELYYNKEGKYQSIKVYDSQSIIN